MGRILAMNKLVLLGIILTMMVTASCTFPAGQGNEHQKQEPTRIQGQFEEEKEKRLQSALKDLEKYGLQDADTLPELISFLDDKG